MITTQHELKRELSRVAELIAAGQPLSDGDRLLERLLNAKTEVPWIDNHVFLMTRVGSFAYGTAIAGKSDLDAKFVFQPPESYYFGLEDMSQYDKSGGKTVKNTADDVDLTGIHVNKFVRDAMKGIPNNIELLFVRPEDIIFCNRYGRVLMEHRQEFLTKALKHKFAGYAFSQKEKMKATSLAKLLENEAALKEYEQLRLDDGPLETYLQELPTLKKVGGRVDLILRHGYDTKFASHAIRLMSGAERIMRDGTYSTYCPNADELLAIRNGKYTLEQMLQMVGDYDAILNELYETSDAVPYAPNYHCINAWLIDLNKQALLETWE